MIDGAEANTGAVEHRPGRERLRRILLALIALLYVVSVPWYRDTDAPLQLRFGLPDWVAVAIACYIGVAVLNAIAWRLTEISDALDPVEGPNENPGRTRR